MSVLPLFFMSKEPHGTHLTEEQARYTSHVMRHLADIIAKGVKECDECAIKLLQAAMDRAGKMPA